MSIRHLLAKRMPPALMGGLLTLTGGLSAPVPVQTSLSVAAIIVAGSAFVPASAATAATPLGTVELSPAPPNVTQSVAPNILLTFDDSGSMAQTNIPDGLKASNQYYYSANSNPVYYNPGTTYNPPLKADGIARFPASTYTSAWKDGMCANVDIGKGLGKDNTGTSCTSTTDLSKSFRTDAIYDSSSSSPPRPYGSGMNNVSNSIGDAGGFYYACPTVNSNSGCKKILVGSTDDTTAGTVDEQRQNFANWYSYYRTRMELTRSAMAETFAQLGKNARVVGQFLNAGSLFAGGTTTFESFADTSTGVGPRTDFFNWLYGAYANNSTPTPAAINAAGKVLTYGKGVKSNKNPYWEEGAGVDGKGMELTCRQNFNVLVTDGYWNSTTSASVKSPRDSYTLPDGVAYDATSTNAQVYSNVPATSYPSLADLAFHYWATNLRPDFTNPADPLKPKLDVPTSITDFTDVNNKPVVWDGKGTPPASIYFNPKNDPATWPHLVQYMVTLGVNGTLNYPGDYDALRQGTKAWSKPASGGDKTDIDDTWHAAISSRGSYLEANDPPSLVAKLRAILSGIIAKSSAPDTGALNTSVLVQGALGFQTSYNSSDWSGTLKAVTVNADGTVDPAGVWSKEAGARLTDRTTSRNILTSTEKADGSFDDGVTFAWANLDDAAKTLISTQPASTDTTNDTGSARVDWISGVVTNDGTLYRKRSTLLGAIIGSQAVYVSYPASGYRNNWPSGSPEATAMAADTSCVSTAPTLATCHSYEAFASIYKDRKPVVYVGANDGMLHAFDASMTQDTSTPPKTVPTTDAGSELFAYVPRSAYGNLGNLPSKGAAKFAPTVDATPVTRDAFFGGAWHTLLVGGLRLGGRGVYALDITDPTAMTASQVLWEFNADAPATASPGCVSNYGSCNPADLGFTYGQPNIGRLANGKWVVLVPGGYFPDCTVAPYNSANCPTPAGAPTTGTPAVAFSSLFVMNAETGQMIAELKTPTGTVASSGLSSPVLGDYNNDQVDDVAFAGDVNGNLWRFDLSSASPSSWKVTLAYKPNTPGAQPITSMPRLFPDPATNRFMVVFGTGKYLGASDATDGTMQSLYGIRDKLDTSTPVTKANLQKQTLYEAASANATNIVRGLTDNSLSTTQGGWYVDLDLTSSPGERVVVTPGALFDTNRVIFTTLIPGTQDPCSTTINGALMVLNAATGGSGGGLSGPAAPTGGWTTGVSTVGGRVTNPPTGGSVPVASVIGGGKLLIPGLELQGGGNLNIDDAIWRRRAWRELNNDL
ncbi:MAG TPA: PilC/PilY family type IV pilus protein [Rhodanobacteraceae bacterium]|jgi:type IV pilus assembly protein PilY1|nr:PilC/PilY family type IV pilus protein [Rhodanobacteraceae bacterium]